MNTHASLRQANDEIDASHSSYYDYITVGDEEILEEEEDYSYEDLNDEEEDDDEDDEQDKGIRRKQHDSISRPPTIANINKSNSFGTFEGMSLYDEETLQSSKYNDEYGSGTSQDDSNDVIGEYDLDNNDDDDDSSQFSLEVPRIQKHVSGLSCFTALTSFSIDDLDSNRDDLSDHLTDNNINTRTKKRSKRRGSKKVDFIQARKQQQQQQQEEKEQERQELLQQQRQQQLLLLYPQNENNKKKNEWTKVIPSPVSAKPTFANKTWVKVIPSPPCSPPSRISNTVTIQDLDQWRKVSPRFVPEE